MMRAMQNDSPPPLEQDAAELADHIRRWATGLGFQGITISDSHLPLIEERLRQWLNDGFHGDMHYMAKHGTKRSRPAELVPGTIRVISARMAYFPVSLESSRRLLRDSHHAYISRYALGRDYHKVLRKRLQLLAERISQANPMFHFRVFTDSAPVMEVALAANGGLGWQGKHTLLLSRDGGSLFFLGEIYTDLPLPIDTPVDNHCGHCNACLAACPTQAIVAPYRLDARRCISYLTIEFTGSIPLALRPLVGNRIYGCDDCQLACPWNKFACLGLETDFAVRHGLDQIRLTTLSHWSEEDFQRKFQGSAILRIGYERWLRNIAVGLGNATTSPEVIDALQRQANHPSLLIREHATWGLAQHHAVYERD